MKSYKPLRRCVLYVAAGLTGAAVFAGLHKYADSNLEAITQSSDIPSSVETAQSSYTQKDVADAARKLVELVKADPTEVNQLIGPTLHGEPANVLPIVDYIKEFKVGDKLVRIQYRDLSPDIGKASEISDGKIGQGDLLRVTFDSDMFNDKNLDGYLPKEVAPTNSILNDKAFLTDLTLVSSFENWNEQQISDVQDRYYHTLKTLVQYLANRK